VERRQFKQEIARVLGVRALLCFAALLSRFVVRSRTVGLAPSPNNEAHILSLDRRTLGWLLHCRHAGQAGPPPA